MAFLNCVSCFKSPVEEDITELDLAHYSLEDVPHQVFVLERTLENLNLECNNIAALPRSLFHCHGLKYLSLADNDLHTLPEAVSCLSQLVELNLSKNVLTELPDSIKQCKHLKSLDLSVNPLQKIPEGCTQLLSITELYLNDTFLEFLPANFGRLAKLKILELRENSLNSLPKSLSRLVCLERLDIGQNDVSDVPPVIGSLFNLRELWMDGNRIRGIPSFIGNLTELVHLEISINRIEKITDAISNCKKLVDFSASTNDLKTLTESVCELENLVTLKIDDNELKELPSQLGGLRNVEELFINQNYLDHLPPSIGLCRKLHTLNIDNNYIEYLPKELGSCSSLRILSAHGNRLTSLPAELDHILNLSVINITANMIQHLPVSFMKLTKISAIWISENQNKPLVQLNQDCDPATGRRVLTNFLLPQVHAEEDCPPDDLSENGSFHASIWEEERSRKSTVKWASGNNESDFDKTGNFRREPTPFPKEMRAMAKRVQNLRSKNLLKEAKIKYNNYSKNQKKEQDNGDDEEFQRIIDQDGGRDSGIVSEEITPDPEEHQRNPSDPLPLAPTRHDHQLNGIEETTSRIKRPPPYHIAAARSKHASSFIKTGPATPRPLDENEEEVSDISNKSRGYHYENHSIIKRLEKNTSYNDVSDSEASTSPSSLQTVLKRPSDADSEKSCDDIASDVESVRNHANKLRQVSEKLLLNGNSSLRSSFARQHSKTSSISRPNSAAAGLPLNTLGLPEIPNSHQNGLLSTIERLAQQNSDDENNGFTQGILRPPGTTILFRQPNYENVVNKSSPAISESPLGQRISTSQYVSTEPSSRKRSQIHSSSRSVINNPSSITPGFNSSSDTPPS